MSNSTNSRPEGRGYNNDAQSFSSPQVSSSFDALAGREPSAPFQATPWLPGLPRLLVILQAKIIRVDFHRCGSKLSEKYLAELRSSYNIPSSVMLIRPNATDRAHIPPLAAGLFPMADADPEALEALRVSFCVPGHASLPPPAAPIATPNRLPMRPPASEPVVVSSSSEEDETMSPLLKRIPRGKL
ncbi:hypothetical protein LIER_02351 [Lithospermum erythrorhizon]|uniref:UBX domain-containing protein n=1 Tax=Lithospermum erythrorhizon TaxID=34254 RepID=A0AAV3NQH8_LITER